MYTPLQVNNAAILVRGAWDEVTYNETMSVDVLGPLSITQQLAPMMPEGSLVIMVSSGGGQHNVTVMHHKPVKH